jgi:ribosomal protein S12 methylthiotransferase
MKLNVTSLGCSKNLVDTEVMLGYLAPSGVSIVDTPEEADCLLVNTCAFLSEAVEEAIDRIMELAGLKEEGRPERLVVTGCLVSRFKEQLLKEIPEIDAVVPPSSLASVLEAVLDKSGRGAEGPRGGGDAAGGDAAASNTTFPQRIMSHPSHQAYLKVGEGCSNHCTYCMIPAIRGEFESRHPVSVVDEMKYLLDMGVKEVTLVSQDSGRFGLDTGLGSLPELVTDLSSVPGDHWLRVLYVHPARVTAELLGALGSDPRVCRYLDVPFQHVSPTVLERMGRGSAPPPEQVVALARQHLPHVSFRTTLMTGFPGETEEDFQQLLSFVQAMKLDHLGVFAYSPEEGTSAAELPGQVEREVAEERKETLMEAQELVSTLKLREYVGRELTVLTEGEDEYGWFGRHQGQAPEVDGVVRLDEEVAAGEFVRVRIVDSEVYDLVGEVIG